MATTMPITFPEIENQYTNGIETEYFPDYDDLAGTVEFSAANLKKVYGAGTAFLANINIGDWIVNKTNDIGDARKLACAVKTIESDTELTLWIDYAGKTGAGKTCRRYKCENTIAITPGTLDISGT